MKFQTLAITLAVSVGAADIPASSSAAAVAPVASQPISARDQCLIGCGAGNIKCQASCDNLPNPTNEDAKKNTECITKCNADTNLTNNQPSLLDCHNACSNSFNPTGSAAATTPSSSGKPDKNSSKKSNGSNGSNNMSASMDPNGSSSDAKPIFMISSTLITLFGAAVSQL